MGDHWWSGGSKKRLGWFIIRKLKVIKPKSQRKCCFRKCFFFLFVTAALARGSGAAG